MSVSVIYKQSINGFDFIIYNSGEFSYGDQKRKKLDMKLNIDKVYFSDDGILRVKDFSSNSEILFEYEMSDLNEAITKTTELKKTLPKNVDVQLVLAMWKPENLKMLESVGIHLVDEIKIIPLNARLITNRELKLVK